MTKFHSKAFDVKDSWDWLDMAYENGWTDGVPVAPPTTERVQAVIDYLRRDPAEEIGVVPPMDGLATVEKVAINCVMAGCKPEYVPVVLAGLEASLDPAFNLNGNLSTTNPCAPLAVVGGPAVKKLGFNAGDGVFGGGARANAAVGRALRLLYWNLGGAIPGVTAKSTLGSPAKYAYCIAENDIGLPSWEPLHVERGFKSDDSVVTMFACDAPHSVYCAGGVERILSYFATRLTILGTLHFHRAGEILAVVTPRVVRLLEQEGYSKRKFHEALYERARWDLEALSQLPGVVGGDDYLGQWWGDIHGAPSVDSMPDKRRLPLVRRPEEILVVVSGGDGQWWGAVCPGWGNLSQSVSRRIVFPG